MNRFANEKGVDNSEYKPKKKGKKNRKKDFKDMSPEERKINKEKTKLKEIYDCLMFS